MGSVSGLGYVGGTGDRKGVFEVFVFGGLGLTWMNQAGSRLLIDEFKVLRLFLGSLLALSKLQQSS